LIALNPFGLAGAYFHGCDRCRETWESSPRGSAATPSIWPFQLMGFISPPSFAFGPELGVGTGVTNSYFYGGHFGLFEVHLFVTPVDLSVFGIDLDATVSAIKVTRSDQGDLIRVAGFEEGGRSDSPAHSRRKTGKLASIPLPGVEDRSDGSAL
jgi:hypothetical protein